MTIGKYGTLLATLARYEKKTAARQSFAKGAKFRFLNQKRT